MSKRQMKNVQKFTGIQTNSGRRPSSLLPFQFNSADQKSRSVIHLNITSLRYVNKHSTFRYSLVSPELKNTFLASTKQPPHGRYHWCNYCSVDVSAAVFVLGFGVSFRSPICLPSMVAGIVSILFLELQCGECAGKNGISGYLWYINLCWLMLIGPCIILRVE